MLMHCMLKCNVKVLVITTDKRLFTLWTFTNVRLCSALACWQSGRRGGRHYVGLCPCARSTKLWFAHRSCVITGSSTYTAGNHRSLWLDNYRMKREIDIDLNMLHYRPTIRPKLVSRDMDGYRVGLYICRPRPIGLHVGCHHNHWRIGLPIGLCLLRLYPVGLGLLFLAYRYITIGPMTMYIMYTHMAHVTPWMSIGPRPLI
jgi:hypothetical protein